ncbi:MAG: hypothetical protein WA280_01825 [Xanthobacteraceae bacterium]
MSNKTMLTVGLFSLPILIWIGIAANIASLRPPVKATTLQNASLLICAAAYLITSTMLVRKALYDFRSLSLTLLALAELSLIALLVYLQLRMKTRGV